MFVNMGGFLRFHEYALHTHFAPIGSLRVIECRCWNEGKIWEENKVRTVCIPRSHLDESWCLDYISAMCSIQMQILSSAELPCPKFALPQSNMKMK